LKSSSRAVRIIVATLGLSAAGAIFGGLAAAIAVVLWGTIVTGDLPFALDAMVFAGTVGAGLGAVLGPVAAWGLLRHVPLGIAVLGATLGAFLGGSVTALLQAGNPLIGGAVGLISGSVFLRYRYARKLKASGMNALEKGSGKSALGRSSSDASLE
jgi:hypothetical protein